MKKTIFFSFVLLFAFGVYAQKHPNDLLEIHYDSENANSIGSANSDIIIAVKFPQELLAPFEGKALTHIKVYISNNPVGSSGVVKIFSAGSYFVPGEAIYSSSPVHVDSNSWNIIPISDFILIPPTDLWIGFEARSGPSGSHAWAGCDSGPNDPDGQYIYFRGDWFQLTALGASFTYNWNLRAFIDPTTDIKNEILPSISKLEQNYPNPFNPNTTINFSLASSSWVTLKVYNIIGQEISFLFNGRASAGDHSVNFNASSQPSGIYIYKLTAAGRDNKIFSSVRKMLLIK